jgi:hypothetical protein
MSPQQHARAFVLPDAFEIHDQTRSRRRTPSNQPALYWNAKPSDFYATLAGRCQQDPRVDLLGPTVDADPRGLPQRGRERRAFGLPGVRPDFAEAQCPVP